MAIGIITTMKSGVVKLITTSVAMTYKKYKLVNSAI